MYIIIQSDNQCILDGSGQIQRFKNPRSAKDFLRDIGVRKPEREGIQIVHESEIAAQETQS